MGSDFIQPPFIITAQYNFASITLNLKQSYNRIPFLMYIKNIDNYFVVMGNNVISTRRLSLRPCLDLLLAIGCCSPYPTELIRA